MPTRAHAGESLSGSARPVARVLLQFAVVVVVVEFALVVLRPGGRLVRSVRAEFRCLDIEGGQRLDGHCRHARNQVHRTILTNQIAGLEDLLQGAAGDWFQIACKWFWKAVQRLRRLPGLGE